MFRINCTTITVIIIKHRPVQSDFSCIMVLVHSKLNDGTSQIEFEEPWTLLSLKKKKKSISGLWTDSTSTCSELHNMI
jgi:hypothetical protein